MASGTAAFGLVIPGRPIVTEFSPVTDRNFIVDVPNPGEITDVVFFLLPNAQLPPGAAATLYFSAPPFDTWSILGAVHTEKPSGVFRTGWSTNENIAGLPGIRLGVSLESISVTQNLDMHASGLEERFHFAHKIALDLFRYMESFQHDNQPGTLVVPADVFQKWLKRFESKYRRDPNFMLKVD